MKVGAEMNSTQHFVFVVCFAVDNERPNVVYLINGHVKAMHNIQFLDAVQNLSLKAILPFHCVAIYHFIYFLVLIHKQGIVFLIYLLL